MTENDNDAQDWYVRRSELVLNGDPWLRVWHEDLQLPDGREVDRFFTIEMPDYVVIVATTMDDRILTLRGYKHGPRRVCTSLPAGFIEAGEAPLDAARRELLEETGYEAERWEPLGSFVNDGNRGGGSGHLFLARGARLVAEPNSGDLETVTVELFTLADLLQAARDGEIGDIPNAAALGLAAARLASVRLSSGSDVV